ncbi:hypothetical protein RchiOBHm_Chr7g0192211 [Rosa chinensis]|uniref:Uncharacterized protein n=1 Tax=Rosa chinensis TaxID=74649 RepID=A0A2P6P5H1_ROSCH|nr:hypothetical protein RchiOBHm_Chr7g0192211 [Rosa chinensis]
MQGNLRSYLGGLLGGDCVEDFIPQLSWSSHFNGLGAKVEKISKGLINFWKLLFEHMGYSLGLDVVEGQINDFVDILLEHITQLALLLLKTAFLLSSRVWLRVVLILPTQFWSGLGLTLKAPPE